MNNIKIYLCLIGLFLMLFLGSLCIGFAYFSLEESKAFIALFYYFNMLFCFFLFSTSIIIFLKYMYKK